MNSLSPNIKINNVLVVYDGTDTDRVVEDALLLSPNYNVLTVEFGKIGTLENIYSPSIIVFDIKDFSEQETVVLMELRQLYDDAPVIVVSEALGDEQIRRLIKLQVHDWLRKPLNKQLFQSALETGIRSAKVSSSRVHAVISAVGGAGGTTFAVCLADMLSKRLKKKKKKSMALFDLDFSTGNCSYILNMMNTYNLETVVNTPSRIDAEFINIIKQKHPAGFNVFSFKRPDVLTQLYGFELVLRMLDVVSIQHDHTILDIPYYEADWKDEVIAAVNTVTIVTEMNLPAIKHTLELAKRIKAIRGQNFPVQVVFNKTKRELFGRNIAAKQIDELFKDLVVVKVANDEGVIRESVNRGVLISEVNSRSSFLKGVNKYMNDHIIPKGLKNEKQA